MRTRDDTVARIATRQHGVVTRRQLLAAGISRSAIRRRVEAGTLLLEYRGVYRVGHRAASLEATYLAAVLACGDGALLVGLAAGYLYGLIKGRAPGPVVFTRHRRAIPGIETHRTSARRAKFKGIPIATVPAVLVQLAAILSVDDLARACHEAGVKYRTTPRQVEAVLRANAPGARKLRAVIRGDAHVTLSELELEFLKLLKRHGLPLPITNKLADGRRIDCRWPGYRLTVELNSYIYHGSRHAWQQDYERQREAYARGDDFRSYTWSDVFEDPTRMLNELRQLLA